MAIRYIYSGQSMSWAVNDDFMVGQLGLTGTNDNTIYGNDRDDQIFGQGSNSGVNSLDSYQTMSVLDTNTDTGIDHE